MENFHKNDKSKAIFKTIASVFLLSLTILTLVYAQAKLDQSTNTISVTGTGEVYAKPDLALTSFSVVTEDKTVDEALEANTKKMNAVIDNMKSLEIEEKDLKTINFNIQPKYEWVTDLSSSMWPQPRNRVLIGYEVTQSLQVKIRDLVKVGEIIQAAAAAGSNQIGSLQFTIDDEEGLKKEARELAIEDAKDKAKELSSQLGVRLIKIISFSESDSSPRYYAQEAVYDSGKGDPVPQIETGENKIDVTVYITYQIN